MMDTEKNEKIKKLINEIAEYYDEPDEGQVEEMRKLTGVDWYAEDLQMLCCGYWESPHTLDELVYFLIHEEWPQKEMNEKFQKILDDIKSSTKMIKILPSDNSVKKRIEKYKINPESLLGIILENTGGIIIDNWIRFYGAGEMDFAARNDLVPLDNLVVAEDILGGLFVYLDNGNIGYFAPDCLELEDMEIHINQFLYWCLHGDTDTFYMDYRWKTWQEDISNLNCNEGVAFYPFLWVQEWIENRTRKIVPIEEIIGLEFDFLKQINEVADA